MKRNDSAASLLRELRERQGHSLRSAASELGIAPSQLSRMERGERSVADDKVQRLSDYYGVASELIKLSQGQVPDDVIAILQMHPEEISRLRGRYRG
jgi:transcriptional regulator with XRE-family HTH domain